MRRNLHLQVLRACVLEFQFNLNVTPKWSCVAERSNGTGQRIHWVSPLTGAFLVFAPNKVARLQSISAMMSSSVTGDRW